MENQENLLLQQWMCMEMTIHRYFSRNFNKKGPMGNPERGQSRLLHIIARKPGITQKELCRICNIRQQSASEFLKKLESGGYITKYPSCNDKRVCSYTLTEQGEAAAKPPKELMSNLADSFKCLTAEEQRNMTEYLLKIQKAIEEISLNGETAPREDKG